MNESQTSDFLIIGSGIAGASVGYFLSELGRVVVLEAEDGPGYHATGRSAAVFTEYYGNAGIRALTGASRAFFEAPPEGFAEGPLLTPRGVVTIASPEQIPAFEAMLAEGARFPVPLYEIGIDEARRLCPVIDPTFAVRALHKPEVRDIDVDLLHQGFLRGMKARGGRLVMRAPATAISRLGGTWQVNTPAGVFTAPIVINAAGAWADAVAELAGVQPVGVKPLQRTAITFDAPEGLTVERWPMVIDAAASFYIKPEGGRILASPCDETPVVPSDVQADEIDVATAAARVEEATTIRVRRIAHRWAGLRTFAPDRMVVIGEAQEAPGFYWFAGQGGYGVQIAPAAARACASLVDSGCLPRDFAEWGLTGAQLSPARFQLPQPTSLAKIARSSCGNIPTGRRLAIR